MMIGCSWESIFKYPQAPTVMNNSEICKPTRHMLYIWSEVSKLLLFILLLLRLGRSASRKRGGGGCVGVLSV